MGRASDEPVAIPATRPICQSIARYISYDITIPLGDRNKRVAFSDDVDGEDKFSALIEMARNYEDCTSFFLSEVGVNASTVWRWASGKSRPSRYVGKRLTEEVRQHLAAVLWQQSEEAGLLKQGTPVAT
jgi:hypothetical protein